MNELFADTFYFVALLSPSDKASQRVSKRLPHDAQLPNPACTRPRSRNRCTLPPGLAHRRCPRTVERQGP